MTKSVENRINVKERVEDDTIDLSLSNIRDIPVKDIAAFRRATILDLSSNNISILSKNFGTLTHLTKLDLSKNQIKLLPGTIGKLTNLRHLDLYNNKLEHLPLELGQLKMLRYLDLKGNPLTPALAKIVGPCLTTKDCQNAARNIVKFLADMQVHINEERQRLKEQANQATSVEENAAEDDDANAKNIVEDIQPTTVAKPKKQKKAKKEKKLKTVQSNSDTNEVVEHGFLMSCLYRVGSIVQACFIMLFYFLFVIAFIALVLYLTHYIYPKYKPYALHMLGLTSSIPDEEQVIFFQKRQHHDF